MHSSTVFERIRESLVSTGLEGQHLLLPSVGDLDPFVRVCPVDCVTIEQGWKLHISADENCIDDVLTRALPVLLEQSVHFKVLDGVESLRRINSGAAGLSQVGKFITVYPSTEAHAERMGRQLHEVTCDVRAPMVPNDFAHATGSIVSYRYGAHEGIPFQTPWGVPTLAVRDTQGNLVEDERLPYPKTPAWVSGRLVGVLEACKPLPELDRRYKRVLLLSSTARHFVSLAMDTSELRPCVIKEANRSASRGAGEQAARDGLRREASVLRHFAGRRGFPSLLDFVDEEDATFLVTEDLAGRSLTARMGDAERTGDPVAVAIRAKWMSQLGQLLCLLHDDGYVYGDLKPDNVLIDDNDDVCLCDFESCRLAGEQATPLMSYGYRAPEAIEGRSAGAVSDIYSFGAIMLFVSTGLSASLYPESAGKLSALLRTRPLTGPGQHMPQNFSDIAARCLGDAPDSRYQEMGTVLVDLRRAESATTCRLPLAPSVERQPRGCHPTDRGGASTTRSSEACERSARTPCESMTRNTPGAASS